MSSVRSPVGCSSGLKVETLGVSRRPLCLGITYKNLNEPASSSTLQFIAHERRLSSNAARTMAAMSLGFIVMVTPWTIQEVVAACTGSKVPPFLDFLVTWFAISNSFWNPFLYWLLNERFRHVCKEIILSVVRKNYRNIMGSILCPRPGAE